MGGLVIVMRKIKSMVMNNHGDDNRWNQGNNKTSKQSQKQKEKVSAEIVRVTFPVGRGLQICQALQALLLDQ